MTSKRVVPHAEQVDKPRIEVRFFDQRQHRALLRVPFKGRTGGRELCVIGQNPSAADEVAADKTIRYVEEYILRHCPEYARLLILNLYSRVDTSKAAGCDLLNEACQSIFEQAIEDHQDFLIIWGKLDNTGGYRFCERAAYLKRLCRGKRVYKLDIGTPYAPHPGNRAILYHNFDLCLAPYDFADIP